MAVQMATFLTGKLNNLVFYQRGGTYIARTVPDKVNQSAATRVRSKNFGIAAVAAKLLRQQLGSSIPFPKDKGMQSRFAGAVARWLGTGNAGAMPAQNDLPYISGFSFNEASSIATTWRVPLTVIKENDHLLQLHIPSFVPTEKIVAPAGTMYLTCTITAACCHLQNSNIQASATSTLHVPYTHDTIPAQVIPLSLPAVAGCLMVTVASIKFFTAPQQQDTRSGYLPCNVIDARYC